MESLFIYLLKVNVLLGIFWTFYWLFLKKESFYVLNRWYFIASIFISFIVPNIWFTKTEYVDYSKEFQKYSIVENKVFNDQSTYLNVSFWDSINWIQILYYVIFLVSVVLLFIHFFKVLKLVKQIKKLPNFKNDCIKIWSDNNTIFSFYKWIVVSKDVIELKNISLIIEHEKTHLKQKHTLDLLLIESIKKLFWFNPILKYMQQSITLNLEFIVDEHVACKYDFTAYQYSLLQTHINHQSNIVTAFSKSDIKKRIIQLNNQKSKRMKKLKFLITIPALTAFFMLFQVNTVAQQHEPDYKSTILLEDEPEIGFSFKIDKNKDEKYLNDIKQFVNSKFKTDLNFSDLKFNNHGLLTNITIKCYNVANNKIEYITYTGTNGIETFNLDLKSKDQKTYTVSTYTNKPEQIATSNSLKEPIRDISDSELQKNIEEVKQMHKKIKDIKSVKLTSISNSVIQQDSTIITLATDFENNKNEKVKFVAGNYNPEIKNLKYNVLDHAIKFLFSENKIPYNNQNYNNLKKQNILVLVNGKEETDLNKIKSNIESVDVYTQKNILAKYGKKAKNGLLQINLINNNTNKVIKKQVNTSNKKVQLENKRIQLAQSQNINTQNTVNQNKIEAENKRKSHISNKA